MCEPACITYTGGATFKVADGKREEAKVCAKRSYDAAVELKNLSDADVIAKVGALFTADQREGGILASVSLAQFILESGYGKSELAQNANNVFGMKKNLSGNTWSGSAWDGVSVYGKQTQEYVDGKKLRYEGLKGCTDYRKAVQIIKDGGYATSLDYVEKLCSIIKRWELTKWDVKDAVSVAGDGGMANGDCPFLVKVSIPDLNIRKGAGTNTGKTGRHGASGLGVLCRHFYCKIKKNGHHNRCPCPSAYNLYYVLRRNILIIFC